MKTKELIKRLQEEDPSGELEVCVGNVDIHFVERLPAYYDGSLQVLQRDENCRFYNITGGKYVRTGDKVNIHTLSITDAISNDPENFKIDYSQLSTDRQESTKKAHDDLREWHRKLDETHEQEYFVRWAAKKAEEITADVEDIKSMAAAFADKHVSSKDPYPEGGVPVGHSYVSMREMQWDKLFEVVVEDGFLGIKKRAVDSST